MVDWTGLARPVADIVFQAMVCRNLSWWRREQADYAKLKDKFGGLHARRFAVLEVEALANAAEDALEHMTASKPFQLPSAPALAEQLELHLRVVT